MYHIGTLKEKMMTNNLFPVPISFHIFNRPETTRKVFEQIKNIKPSQLFITADGPRENIAGDNEKCREVRSIVDDIDWECKVFTNFAESNKGSYKSTSEGITWVFEHVDRAIILEDDCIPHPSFFRFCHELLDYYENDERIALISGNNFQLTGNKTEHSYYFSRYTHIWGFATWKRTWNQVDLKMQCWPEFKDMKGLQAIFRKNHEVKHWEMLFQGMYEGKIGPHWDYLLSLSSYMNHTLAILPNVNLVSNIGYGVDASNCKSKSRFQELNIEEIKFPLKHPKFICRYVDADNFTELNIFSRSKFTYLKSKIAIYLPKYLKEYLKLIYENINRKKHV